MRFLPLIIIIKFAAASSIPTSWTLNSNRALQPNWALSAVFSILAVFTVDSR